MTEIVIASGARTPVGSFAGAFANVPAHDLGTVAIKAALERAKVAPGEVSEVILGQILTAAQGQNPGRQAAMKAGIPVETPAYLVNQLCGSGLRAVALGYQSIRNGDASIIVAGGQESMSMAPHAAHLRNGQKLGALEFVDTMIKDGLTDAFHSIHMGITAENVAREFQITREEQDRFAVASQNKAEAARKAGRFKDEIVPVTVTERKGVKLVEHDEYIRDGVTYESVSGLAPGFRQGRHGDGGQRVGPERWRRGAGADEREGCRRARDRAAGPHRLLGERRRRSQDHGHGAHSGLAHGAEEGRLEPGRSRSDRIQRSLRGAGLRGEQERSAGTRRKVNVNGGAIAIGHPIGASGGRILVTLLYEMGRRNAKKGIATMCIGGGMGIAVCVER